MIKVLSSIVVRRRRIFGACGMISQLVGLAVLLIAAFSSSWFSWVENDISVLGVEGSATTLFNPHNLASIAFFVFIALALILIGAATLSASRIMWGLMSLTAGVLVIAFQLISWPWNGGAIPCFLTCHGHCGR